MNNTALISALEEEIRCMHDIKLQAMVNSNQNGEYEMTAEYDLKSDFGSIEKLLCTYFTIAEINIHINPQFTGFSDAYSTRVAATGENEDPIHIAGISDLTFSSSGTVKFSVDPLLQNKQEAIEQLTARLCSF
jgi:hypothetical protein